MEFAIPRNVHTLLPDILFNAQLQIWSIAVQTPPPPHVLYIWASCIPNASRHVFSSTFWPLRVHTCFHLYTRVSIFQSSRVREVRERSHQESRARSEWTTARNRQLIPFLVRVPNAYANGTTHSRLERIRDSLWVFFCSRHPHQHS